MKINLNLILIFNILFCLTLCQNASLEAVCNNARIPLDYVDLGDKGGICVVRQKPNPQINADGNYDSYTCNQNPFQGNFQTSYDSVPRTDACPLNLGTCNTTTGKCDYIQNGYYFENFKRQYTGLNTWDTITLTYYSGTCACLSDVQDAVTCLQEKLGIDGMAAVPSMMFGKWEKTSQSCVLNNDICYKITGATGKSAVVAVGDRCGGYAQCSPEVDLGSENYSAAFPFDFQNMAYDLPHINNTAWVSESNCVFKTNVSVNAGTTPSCKVQTPPLGLNGSSCCPDKCYINGQTHYVDWCAMQDHPHFDLSQNVFEILCGADAVIDGTCIASKVEPVVCPNWSLNVCLSGQRCPLNSYPDIQQYCSPTNKQVFYKNGTYTGCCCSLGFLPNSDGTACIKQDPEKNCQCNVLPSVAAICEGDCAKACNNQTYCDEFSAFCSWENSSSLEMETQFEESENFFSFIKSKIIKLF